MTENHTAQADEMAPPENSADASARAVVPANANSDPGNRDELGRFVAGRPSGNPSGRPRAEALLRELAQQHGAAVILKLFELSKSESEKIAVLACRELLDRGYGRPRESIDLNADVVARPGIPDSRRRAMNPDGSPGERINDLEASQIYALVMRGDMEP